MLKTLFFYDLETSGFSPIDQRIMQFAGQRTNLKLEPIGEPVNFLIKLSDEILPDPDAILLTGITPQKTIDEGISELEFLKIFSSEIAVPETIFTGFNSVRFDDEFIRYLLYRNFYDPYEWQWKDGRGKWDLLDVVRMTRALRPEGINWTSEKGAPTNRLELLTKENKISHVGAHDALSDVVAMIDLAKLLKSKQPKLFDYLFNTMRDKDLIAKLVNDPKPFIYTSSKYPSEFQKTTIVGKLVDHPKRAGVLVFDLRFKPTDFSDLSVDELIETWQNFDKDKPRLPVKTLQFNRCPAIAPISVLDPGSQARIGIDIKGVEENFASLSRVSPDFSRKILEALRKLDAAQEKKYAAREINVDGMLYDGFFNDSDKKAMQKVRSHSAEGITDADISFHDSRLKGLMPLYKARNFRKSLSSEEIERWEEFKRHRLLDGGEQSKIATFFSKLQELSTRTNLTSSQRYLSEELKLYAESIIPFDYQ